MKRIAQPCVTSIVSVGAAALIGCAHEHAPPVETAPPIGVTETTSHVAPPAPAATAERAPTPGLNVSDEILKTCKINFDNIETAPEFDFDKSDLRADERALLEKVAACVTSGPLKGRSLKLVGRADPRGEVEYNFVLGESRAGSVRSYLMGLGLGSSRISTTSRGELDATGTDEASWQRDRRVDLDLL